jgi:Tol biopolymer transport system component
MSAAAFLAWARDSKHLIVTMSPGAGKPDALFVTSSEAGQTGNKRQLTTPERPSWGDSNPAVSPDGRSLVFRRAASASIGQLFLLPLTPELTAEGDPVPLTQPGGDAAFPTWLPDGKRIVFSDTRALKGLWRLKVNRGGAAEEAERVPFVGDDAMMPVASPRPSISTRLVYRRTLTDHNVYRLDLTAAGAHSGARKAVFNSGRTDIVGDMTADGTTVAFASNRTGDLENLARGHRRLERHPSDFG